MSASKSRTELRERLKVEHLAKKPSWWRVFARRRWSERWRLLCAMDVSAMADLLASLYSPKVIEEMVTRTHPALRLIGKSMTSGAPFYTVTTTTKDKL